MFYFESTLSIFFFVLAPNFYGEALYIRVRKAVCLYPFRYVFQWHSLIVLRLVVYPRKIAADTHLIFFRLFHPTTSIFSMQSPQMRFTALVALTLFLQHGHWYFLVLLGRLPPSGCMAVPLLLCVPPAGTLIL